MKFAHVCERKGATDKWIVGKIIEDIDRLGHTEVILKGDGEPVPQEVLQEVFFKGFTRQFFRPLFHTVLRQTMQLRKQCRRTWAS